MKLSLRFKPVSSIMALMQKQNVMKIFLQTGIIDPVKVTRLALENATSVAMMVLTTECVVARKSEKETFTPLPPEI